MSEWGRERIRKWERKTENDIQRIRVKENGRYRIHVRRIKRERMKDRERERKNVFPNQYC